MSAESSAYYIAKLAEKDRAASPWIAVADRLPPNNTCVLTWGRHGYDIGSLIGHRFCPSVTHWMTLPVPPTKETA